MANPNNPSAGETGEPKSEFSGHTMERARNQARSGVAPLVAFLAASAAAGITGVAKKAAAEVRCDPVPFSIPSGASSVNGTVTPQGNGALRVDARFSERADRSYGMTVNLGDQCTDQAGIDVTVDNRRGPHLNACTCERGLCLFHTPRDAQGRRVRGGHVEMAIPHCVEAPPAQGAGQQPAVSGEAPASGGSTGAPSTPAVPPVVPSTPRAPDPRRILDHLPGEFTVRARFEPSPNRSSGMRHVSLPLSVPESFARGLLRKIQYGPNQLPAPEGMDFNRAHVFPDGNGGLYIYVPKSISRFGGAPDEAVYRAHALQSEDFQNFHFVRIGPARGSEVGSGGPATLPLDGVIAVQNGEFSVRPRESTAGGPSCDAIALPAEGVVGKNPIAILCELVGRLGRRAAYIGSVMIDGTNLTDPNAVVALQRANRLAIVNREASVDPESERMDLAQVAVLLERMPSSYDDDVPDGVRELDRAAIRFFMRPDLRVVPNVGQAPATPAPRPATPLLPSSAPDVSPPAQQAPGSFRPHRVQNRRPA